MSETVALNEFGPSSYESWLKLVERDLAGAPFEKKLIKKIAGIDVRPLYTRKDRAPEQGLPGFHPFRRGGYPTGSVEMGWEVRQEIDQTNPARAAAAALDALNGGVRALSFRFDRALRSGTDGHGEDGIAAYSLAELEQAFGETRIDWLPIHLRAGASTFAVAAALVGLAKNRGLPLTALSGSFGADPIGTLARIGTLPGSLESALEELAELARFASEHAPRVRAVSVDVTGYHEAGADAPTEVAVALATGVAYLRALTGSGLSIDAAAAQMNFELAVGRDVFVEIAKLRAARLTWAKVLAACGAAESSRVMAIHARTSLRTKTERDPWVNLLRGTGETFAAAVGGAEAITNVPFDALLGESDEFGARMARNTQELLRHESNLHRVVDPAGGSWYVEELTDGVARLAWEKFTAFEAEGGMAAVLRAGILQKDLSQALAAERKAVETRRLAITGVNEFPHVKEEPVARAVRDVAAAAARSSAADGRSPSLPPFDAGHAFEQAVAAVRSGVSFATVMAAARRGEGARAPALRTERLAEPFESLRDIADRFTAARGKRPAAFLANLGPIPEHKARAGFAQNYLEAGGFTTIGNDGFADAESAAAAFVESGADVVVLCSSDAVYAELAEAAARALAARGARVIALAGSPGERESAYRAAGITDFVFVGVNAAESLRSFLERVGAR
ncbi:MAG TPA: methylmalonyl-CoA mutase family protein [Polyangiaceae bacterium]|nr:methylmalonyl-CoA mutase family protein [Polyangiaceae bacterium]